MTEPKLLSYVTCFCANLTFNKQINKEMNTQGVAPNYEPLREICQSLRVILFLIIAKNVTTFTDTKFFIIRWHYGGILSLVNLIYSHSKFMLYTFKQNKIKTRLFRTSL